MQQWEMTPEQIKEKMDNMVWSFSRVNSSTICPYSWYLQYIEEQDGEENAFAQFGTICHKTLEKYFLQELDMFSVLSFYEEHYSEYVTYDFPPNKYVDLGQKAFDSGYRYFSNLYFDFDKYEVLGVEQENLFKVGDYPFKGYIDVLFKNRETGEIIISDNKTSSFKYLKNGDVSSKDREHYESFKRQLYLYSIPVLKKYGRVDKLSWNMIRDEKILEIPWERKELDKTIEWAIESIKALEQEQLWLPDTSNSYMCNVLCNFRNICPYR